VGHENWDLSAETLLERVQMTRVQNNIQLWTHAASGKLDIALTVNKKLLHHNTITDCDVSHQG